MHLAFGKRVMLADDMGLGKTVQAIAAAALLRQLNDISCVLVVSPASLKHQWAREIGRFTNLGVQVIGGLPSERRRMYAEHAFFNMINYELVLRDFESIRNMRPDIIILDEAQRIKNWRTKTATAVKRLESPYAFVLTGTPLENHLGELWSMFHFLMPGFLGGLTRFNTLFRNPIEKQGNVLRQEHLRQRIKPFLLRRSKQDVASELPKKPRSSALSPCRASSVICMKASAWRWMPGRTCGT